MMLEEEEEEEEVEEVGEVYCSANGGGGGGGAAGSGGKKRRLGAEQVRALERSFEEENRLEPERKLRLAQELGLQPRQVAVWFQNRRARWKTKQLERDFNGLKSRYEALRHDSDALRLQNNSLLAELAALKSNLSSASRADPKQQEEERMEAMSTPLPPPPADSDSSAGVLTDDDSRLGRGTVHQAPQLFKMDGGSSLCADQAPCISTFFSGEHLPSIDWFCPDLAGNGTGDDADCWL